MPAIGDGDASEDENIRESNTAKLKRNEQKTRKRSKDGMKNETHHI
jgi:hypothetical protein